VGVERGPGPGGRVRDGEFSGAGHGLGPPGRAADRELPVRADVLFAQLLELEAEVAHERGALLTLDLVALAPGLPQLGVAQVPDLLQGGIPGGVESRLLVAV